MCVSNNWFQRLARKRASTTGDRDKFLKTVGGEGHLAAVRDLTGVSPPPLGRGDIVATGLLLLLGFCLALLDFLTTKQCCSFLLHFVCVFFCF